MKLMKKTNRLFFITFVSCLLSMSCVNQHDFEVPMIIGNEENSAFNRLLDSINNGTLMIKNINDIKADFFKSREVRKINGNYVLKGYVTSSDETGNFYKELYVQDKPKNPTAGIKVSLNQVSSYNQFNFGREIYIKLKGLYIGETRSGDNNAAIGGSVKSGRTELAPISENQIKKFNHILRSRKTEEITPLNLKFSEIGEKHLGMFLQVNNVFFSDALKGASFLDPKDDFSTERVMQSCDGFEFSEFILETSSFAIFGASPLPTGGGYIKGVIIKNYNRKLRFTLNSLSDVNMNGKKCQPLNINDFEEAFFEDFQSSEDHTDFAISGWVNFNEEGNEFWTEQVFKNNGYAEFSGFKTNDNVNIGWLITPKINILLNKKMFLSFQVAQHHLENAKKNTLEVFVSSDFDGTNVIGATWIKLPAFLPNENAPWYQFQDAGLIDVSNFGEALYIGFKSVAYGNDSQLDGAYMIDDVKVLYQK